MGGLVGWLMYLQRYFKVLPFTLSDVFLSLTISLLFIKCQLMWIELAYHPGTSVCYSHPTRPVLHTLS